MSEGELPGGGNVLHTHTVCSSCQLQ